MSETRNFAVEVTQTQVVMIQVKAETQEQAERFAKSDALRKGFANTTLTTKVPASWPLGEPEDDFIIPTERGYEVRRGWFWSASLDFESISLTASQIWSEYPEADARDMKTFRPIFDSYVFDNQTVFNISRTYGFASRQAGDVIWSNVVNTQAQAEREARSEVNRRAGKARAAEFRSLIDHTIAVMKEPGNGNALLRVKGGSWTVKNVLGDRDPTDGIDTDTEWSVPVTVVNALIDAAQVDVLGRFSQSEKPFHVGLSDRVLRPF